MKASFFLTTCKCLSKVIVVLNDNGIIVIQILILLKPKSNYVIFQSMSIIIKQKQLNIIKKLLF
jgi:hypothetical protein